MKKRRKIIRKIGDKISKEQEKEETEEELQKIGPELEKKTTLAHLKKIIEYFGSKDSPLTQEQREKIKELAERVKVRQKR